MFESTLEAQGLNDGERRVGSLSAAALAHVGIGAAILAVTALIVPPVQDPNEPPHFVPIVQGPRLDDVSPQLPPKPPIRGTQTAKPGPTIVRPPVPREPAPAVTPERLPEPAPEVPAVGGEQAGEGPPGDPGGSDRGVIGGIGVGEGSAEGGDGLPGDPLFVTGEMVRPVLLVKVEPVYPEVARRAGLSGKVTVSAVIGLEGGVESAEVLASTNPLFDRAALDAVRKWRYRPATMSGRPVRVYFTVVVDFLVR